MKNILENPLVFQFYLITLRLTRKISQLLIEDYLPTIFNKTLCTNIFLRKI